MPRTRPNLLRRAREGDAAAREQLLGEAESFVHVVCSGYFAPHGCEHDDLLQEARVGALAAIRDWRPGFASWETFLGVCVRRSVMDFIRTATRSKHRVLTSALRDWVESDEDGEEMSLFDAIEDRRADVPSIVERREELRRIGEVAATLSERERRALLGIASGLTYVEIEGTSSGAKPKWVDNAVQRARKKLAA